MTARVETDDGVFELDLEHEELVEYTEDARLARDDPPDVSLPLLVAAAASGSTVVAVVSRRPPLAISHDAGATWREAGGGLPRGVAVAVDPRDPDRILFAARNRVYLSENGGVFWRALPFELPEIRGVSF